jgi:HlyD family secretion protein
MSEGMDRPIERPWWQKTWAVATGAAIALCAVIAGAVSMLSTDRTLRLAAERVTLATVEQGTFHDFIPLRGQVVPRDVVYVNTREGGRVEKVLVLAGDMVTEDQPLIELSNPDLEREVMVSELSLVEQINVLRNTEMTLEDTRIANERALADIDYNLKRLQRQAERQKYYFSKGVTSAEERDKAVDELAHYTELRAITEERNKRQEEMRQIRAPELRNALSQAQKNLTYTRQKLDALTVRAPATGRLSRLIDLRVGQNLARAEHIGDVTLDTGFKLSADIDEYYLARVRTGQQAVVDKEGREVVLEITRVYPQVKEGRFAIDLAFEGEGDAPGGLLAGQALQGKLMLGDDRPALLLPAGAFLEETGGDWIFVLSADDDAWFRRRIKVGRRNAEQLEILEGLQAGERALISDYRGFDRIDRIVLSGGGS